MKVDFPEPEGPMTATNSPLLICTHFLNEPGLFQYLVALLLNGGKSESMGFAVIGKCVGSRFVFGLYNVVDGFKIILVPSRPSLHPAYER